MKVPKSSPRKFFAINGHADRFKRDEVRLVQLYREFPRSKRAALLVLLSELVSDLRARDARELRLVPHADHNARKHRP